jgi:hypothetical protein
LFLYLSLKKINQIKYYYFFFPTKTLIKRCFLLPKLIFCYLLFVIQSTRLLLSTTHPLHHQRKSHGFLLMRFPSTNRRRQPSTTSRRSYVLLEIQIQVFFLLLFCFSNLGYTIHLHICLLMVFRFLETNQNIVRYAILLELGEIRV